MFTRTTTDEITGLLGEFPAVALIGARQVGKTTLARLLAREVVRKSVYLDLERPSDRAKLTDPELFLRAHRDALVVLDEVHRVPDLFPVLRSEIDEGRQPGRFLILGSASPDLLRQSSESLAGRIAYRELGGLNLSEVGAEDYQKLWLRGGFPLSYSAASEVKSWRWREAFVRTWLERDLPAFGIRVAASALQRFWQMVAHVNGQLWNGHQLASSMGVTPPSVARYLDLLQDLFVVRRLDPFHGNLRKRLVKTPKIYFRDTGLLHTLLHITSHDDLLSHPALGPSWETFCIEQIMQVAPRSSEAYFYRTSAGAEVDLVVFPPGARRPIVFECKHALAPKLGPGFHSAIADLEPTHTYIITPTKERYPFGERITVLPVEELPALSWSH